MNLDKIFPCLNSFVFLLGFPVLIHGPEEVISRDYHEDNAEEWIESI